MYRVVIVDDEEPVLDSFSFILAKQGEDFELCGKARSGLEAIRLINDAKPDLVFMDVQMPGIDGIEAITQLRLQYPETVFILATAYERFDIAQRAIPLGIFSYLVKPISRKMLTDELQRVKLHLDQTLQRSRLHLQEVHFLQKSKEEAKNALLRGLTAASPTFEEWEVFSRLFSLRTERGTIRVAEPAETLSPERRAENFLKLKEKLQFKFICFNATAGGREIFFFPEDAGLERLDSYIQDIQGELGPVRLAIGRSGIYHYSRLADAFSEALRSLQEATTSEKSVRSEREETERIRTAFLSSDFSQGLPLFEEFWMKVFREARFEVAKGRMVALFTLLYAGFDSEALTAFHLDVSPAEAIMGLASVDQWREWASEQLDCLQSLLSHQKSRFLPGHLTKALSFIHRRFAEPIQLSSVAEECQITSSYLCRLFSEHLGTSFVEYLTRYRLNRAGALLKENRHSIKEISGMVGFQDPNYFSRIFRRYEGTSPSEVANGRKR